MIIVRNVEKWGVGLLDWCYLVLSLKFWVYPLYLILLVSVVLVTKCFPWWWSFHPYVKILLICLHRTSLFDLLLVSVLDLQQLWLFTKIHSFCLISMANQCHTRNSLVQFNAWITYNGHNCRLCDLHCISTNVSVIGNSAETRSRTNVRSTTKMLLFCFSASGIFNLK